MEFVTDTDQITVFKQFIHTMVISLRILAAELCANNLEHIKSVSVASSSPMYSMIFLLIQGFILLSINTCREIKQKWAIQNMECIYTTPKKYPNTYKWSDNSKSEKVLISNPLDAEFCPAHFDTLLVELRWFWAE